MLNNTISTKKLFIYLLLIKFYKLKGEFSYGKEKKYNSSTD